VAGLGRWAKNQKHNQPQTKKNKNMPISDVSEKSGWIVVFDDRGKEIKRMGSSNKEVAGVASDFFVVLERGWIVTYDENCKEIKRMGDSNKTVRSASGTTFTVLESNWIVTYDRKCKEQARRGK
jgi:L-asparaginase II